MNTLIGILIIWVLVTFGQYYFSYGFIAAAIWVVISASLLAMIIRRIIELYNGSGGTPLLLSVQLVIFVILLSITLQESLIDKVIQKVDWSLFKSKRMEVVTQIKKGELLPDSDNYNGKLKLPFTFPMLSTGGNEVWIRRDDATDALSIYFPVTRNFYGIPIVMRVYTEDPKIAMEYQKRIIEDPEKNKKLANGWYHIREYSFQP